MISAVNLAETISKFVERGMDIPDIRRAVERSFLTIIPFDADLAWRAGLLRTTTRHLGLSLGDRACLALAEREGGVAVTCDRAWREVADVAVELVRP
jgi:PIN domain nuclease of toxin-antitoxin system